MFSLFFFFGEEQMFVDCNIGFIDPPHCNLDFSYTLFVLVENVTFSIRPKADKHFLYQQKVTNKLITAFYN